MPFSFSNIFKPKIISPIPGRVESKGFSLPSFRRPKKFISPFPDGEAKPSYFTKAVDLFKKLSQPATVSGSFDRPKPTPFISDDTKVTPPPTPEVRGVEAPSPTPTAGKTNYDEMLGNVFEGAAGNFSRILRWGDWEGGGEWGKDYGGENLQLDPRAENENSDGSIDRGMFQINSNTFEDFQRRKPEQLEAAGIGSYEDMFDPEKNMRMAKIIWEEQGFGAWVGAPPDLLE